MPFQPTEFAGLYVIEPAIYQDSRGYFFESYNERNFEQQGINLRFVQDNQSNSSFGVLRGLHYQLNPNAQTKLVRVLSGKILDVVVDLRTSSPTFKNVYSIELSAENKRQLLIPHGFAHGFSVLSEKADVFYKCDNFYSKESETGIRFNDPALKIDWRIPVEKMIVSDKDLQLPLLADCRNNF